MPSNTSNPAQKPSTLPASSKRSFGTQTSFLRRDDTLPTTAASQPKPSVPAAPLPSAPEFQTPDTTRSIVTHQPDPVAAEGKGKSSVSILLFTVHQRPLTNIDCCCPWPTCPFRYNTSNLFDVPCILPAQDESSSSTRSNPAPRTTSEGPPAVGSFARRCGGSTEWYHTGMSLLHASISSFLT